MGMWGCGGHIQMDAENQRACRNYLSLANNSIHSIWPFVAQLWALPAHILITRSSQQRAVPIRVLAIASEPSRSV